MQLDLFDSQEYLKIQSSVSALESSLNKTRRSLFARVNELERMVLDLQEKLEQYERTEESL